MSSERKPCARCGRAIDGWAKVCPFCNWDQAAPPPLHEVVPAPVAAYKPPDEERSVKTKLSMIGAGVLVLIAAFGVGMIINSDDAPKNAPETLEEQAAEHNVDTPKRADTPLIPTNERGGFEQPITSAPVLDSVGGTSNDYQRTDATAVSSVEYAEIAKRARAEKARMARVVDPRSITGQPYVPAPRRRASTTESGTAAGQARIARTRPVPEYQPLPHLGAGRARLTLLVGADGRVQQVGVDRSMPGRTTQLISAVQRWRFKPATENGRPVAAPYTVEISFE